MILAGALLLLGGCRSELPKYSQIPDFQLTAVDGADEGPLARQDLLGAPWVASLLFTSCQGPCPCSRRGSQSSRTHSTRAWGLTFTVDPKTDTPRSSPPMPARCGSARPLAVCHRPTRRAGRCSPRASRSWPSPIGSPCRPAGHAFDQARAGGRGGLRPRLLRLRRRRRAGSAQAQRPVADPLATRTPSARRLAATFPIVITFLRRYSYLSARG